MLEKIITLNNVGVFRQGTPQTANFGSINLALLAFRIDDL